MNDDGLILCKNRPEICLIIMNAVVRYIYLLCNDCMNN